MVGSILPAHLHEKFKSNDEICLLDVREQGVHSQGHPFFATSLPLSMLELKIEQLVPRKNVPIFLLDQGDAEALSQKTADKLLGLGYADITIVENGIIGWHEAGLEIFSGINVPSKAFGEFVEHENQTPNISAEDLQERIQKGESLRILDSRPFGEFHRMCIPGGIDTPGAELAYRASALVADDVTPIIVNCAGRTRSIIGAQSLINAGIKNPVMALRDGTMGWYLAGNELEKNAERIAAEPNAQELLNITEQVQSFAGKTGIEVIDLSGLEDLQKASDKQTLYILDVRTKEEFLSGHVLGSFHAPGGQLVQATDEYVAVRGASLVLVDDKKVRALMTGSWLRQMGWDNVYIFSSFSECELEIGEPSSTEVEKQSFISPMELDAVISSGEPIAVIDLATSLSYAAGHVPGAFWAIRARLAHDLIFLPPVGLIIVTADDERLAHLASKEILKIRPEVITRVLQGGNDAWRSAGMRVEAGDTHLLSKAEDVWYKPYDNKNKIRERMQEYLDWEVALVGQVKRDGLARFRVLKN
ncbi:MAG: rhodanese-like domain-containing protein [Sneathiella sp.]